MHLLWFFVSFSSISAFISFPFLQQDHTYFIIHLFIKSKSETNHIGKNQLNNAANNDLLGVSWPKNLVYPYGYSYNQNTLSVSG